MKRLFLSLLTSLALCLSLTACSTPPVPVPRTITATTPCLDLVVAGFPLYEHPQAGNWFVCHQGYVLDYNTRSRTPMWVGEHLTRANLEQPSATRTDNFRPDPKIPANLQASLEDYRHSGFDRGHQAPAGDFTHSLRQMSESFYLTNMVPQNSNNNRGIWAELEKNVRAWAKQRGQLYVFTGPIFYQGRPLGWIGRQGSDRAGLAPGSSASLVAVPTHLYKVIYDPARQEVICFIIPNAREPLSALPEFATNLSTVMRLTGLEFFPKMDPRTRAHMLASSDDFQAWPLFK